MSPLSARGPWKRCWRWNRWSRSEVRRAPRIGWEWRAVVHPLHWEKNVRVRRDSGWALTRAAADSKATRACVELRRNGGLT